MPTALIPHGIILVSIAQHLIDEGAEENADSMPHKTVQLCTLQAAIAAHLLTYMERRTWSK